MSLSARESHRLQDSVDELCEILQRLRELHVDLLDVLMQKEAALVEVRVEELEEYRQREEELLRAVIEEEKERLLITEAVGDLLGHEQPVRITAEEILSHLPLELGKRFSEQRADLRAVAQRLGRQNAVNRALIEHSVGHIQLFLSKLANEEMGLGYGPKGSSGGNPPNNFLMDRRA